MSHRHIEAKLTSKDKEEQQHDGVEESQTKQKMYSWTTAETRNTPSMAAPGPVPPRSWQGSGRGVE